MIAEADKSKATIKDPSKKGLIVKILIAVIVIVAVVVGISLWSTNGANKTADKIISNIQIGNCEEVYDVTSSQFKENTTFEDWSSICQNVGSVLQGEPEDLGVTVAAETGQDTSAEAQYRIKGTDDLSYLVTLRLVKENNQWLLLGLDSNEE